MTFDPSPSTTAAEFETVSRRYEVQMTEKSYLEMQRIQAIEDGAGFLDGIGLSVGDVINNHEMASKHGF